MPALESEQEKAEALQALEDDVYAASSLSSVRGRRRCYELMLRQWNVTPFPASSEKVRFLAAALKAGGYRSAQNILSQFKVDSERKGHTWSGPELRLFTDVSRACARGMGPPVRSAPLPFSRLHSLPSSWTPWVVDGPVGPRNAIICGSWWLLRELELSGLRACLATIDDAALPTATLLLPASKADITAQGASRSHACVCAGGAPRPDCPVHSLWDQLLLLRRLFGSQFVDGAPPRDMPLFPRRDGKPATKAAMVATIEFAARALRVDMVSPDGSRRVSGHSLRPTGAVGLTQLGLDVWTVQLLGRWGSSVVCQYVNESSTSREAAAARSHQVGRTLRDVAAAGSASFSADDLRDFTADEVLRVLRVWTPNLTKEIKESILPDLVAAVEAQRIAPDGASSSSSDTEPAEAAEPAQPEHQQASDLTARIASVSTNRVHKILIGPAHSLNKSSWVCYCGWKFGAGAFRDATPEDLACRKCGP